MSGLPRTRQRLSGRCRPRLEWLEPRLVLSVATPQSGAVVTALAVPSVSAFDMTALNTTGSFLTVVGTDPANQATLSQSPASISVQFDRAIDPLSFGFMDVLIQQEVNGSWTTPYDIFHAPGESLDPTGAKLILTPSAPLAPGHYRIVLPTGSALMGTDFSVIDDTGQDQVLSEFTISDNVSGPHGTTLANATDLGVASATVTTVADTLSLDTNPADYHLFKFTLQPGHHYRVGLEVLAQRIGSPLLTTLALFDSQGHVLATSSFGRPGAPADPYLFQGLDAGTYFIGVSGRGNDPSLPSGYNPATGDPGTLAQAMAPGAYQLNVVADVADSPTQLLGYRLDYADPLSSQPTGLTLAFSGLLNLATVHGDPTAGLVLVNQNGQTYHLTAVGFDESTARYRFVFDQPVPSGRYTLRVSDPSNGGLTDLAGYTPVAAGLPAGVLATFNIRGTGNGIAGDPFNLGALTQQVLNNLTTNVAVAPNAAVTYRFVTLTEGHYHLVTPYTGGSLSVMMLGPEGLSYRDAGPSGGAMKNDFVLQPGVHYLQFINLGSTAARLQWTLSVQTRFDSLLDNGVGQGPALDMRLVSPTNVGLTAPVDTSSGFGPFVNSQAGSNVGSTVANSTGGYNANGSLAPSGLVVTPGNTLVGRPSAEAEHVATVGPSATGGGVAVASVGQGLLQGINYTTVGQLSLPDAPAPHADAAGDPLDEAVPKNGAIVVSAEPVEPEGDAAVIADADWFGKLGTALARLMRMAPRDLSPQDSVEPAGPPLGGAVEQIAMTRDDAPVRSSGSDGVEQAQLSAPLAIGVLSIMSLRHRLTGRHWLPSRRETADSRRRASLNPFGGGPHRRR